MLHLVLGAFSGGAGIGVGFMLEKLFLEEWPWWGWGIVAVLCLGGVLCSLWMQHRLLKPKQSNAVVDYTHACLIINRYIDPDQTMRDGVRMSVRGGILAMFEDVVGARVGERYNGELLHRWLQKNAARILVAHRSEVR